MPKLHSALIVTLLAAFLLAAQPAYAGPFDKLFGYVEEEQNDIEVFPQWRSVIERPAAPADTRVDCESGNNSATCHLQRWAKFLKGLRGRPSGEQLAAVNNFVNDQNYVGDEANYGKEDHWALPDQFLSRGGDCEDFAILKFFSLRALGWPPESLRLVIVQDTKLNQPHAVLAVAEGEDVWILDNQAKTVVDPDTVDHYAPVYSLGAKHWWLHSPSS
jgi:predicted transglutaminase-like cysteine proteinase